MHFPMRIKPSARWLLRPFGATGSRSFVDVDETSVRFRFGFFDESVLRQNIVAVEPYQPRWFAGIGWRYWPRHVLLLGSHEGVLSFTLARPQAIALFPFLPRFVPVTRISVSVLDAAALKASLLEAGM